MFQASELQLSKDPGYRASRPDTKGMQFDFIDCTFIKNYKLDFIIFCLKNGLSNLLQYLNIF